MPEKKDIKGKKINKGKSAIKKSIAFDSDGGQFKQLFLVSTILLVYFIIVLTNYSRQMKNEAYSRVYTDIVEDNIIIADGISSYVEKCAQITKTIATIVSHEEAVLSETNYTVLRDAVGSTSAEYGYISDLKGNAVDIKGNSINVWTNQDYAQALTGISSMSAMGDYEGGSNMICFFSPVEEKGLMKGVVCLQFSTSDFDDYLGLGDDDGHSIYSLIQADGKIISSVGIRHPEIATSIYDYITANTEETKESIEKKIRQNLENNKEGQLDIGYENKDYFMSYKPVGVNGWYVVEISAGAFVSNKQMQYYSLTKTVVTKIFVALFLFICVVIGINIINKAIFNRRNSELQNKAETDLLTGVLNKMATEKHIKEYLDGEGANEPGMLFLLDIDNFKKINDTMGHAFGDQVLSTLGVKLRNQFRTTDIIGRIGGDEFMVYLKKIPNEDIRKKEADKMLQFFRSFQAGDYVKYSATASIGVALYPDDASNFTDLYKAADKGVYLSKQKGKNALSFYEETKDPVKAKQEALAAKQKEQAAKKDAEEKETNPENSDK